MHTSIHYFSCKLLESTYKTLFDIHHHTLCKNLWGLVQVVTYHTPSLGHLQHFLFSLAVSLYNDCSGFFTLGNYVNNENWSVAFCLQFLFLWIYIYFPNIILMRKNYKTSTMLMYIHTGQFHHKNFILNICITAYV